MQDHILKAGIPFSLTLSADARLNPIDFSDDQTWNLNINRGEPTGLILETTYGLRARSQRIFPRFTEGDTSVTSPLEFQTPVLVKEYYPNYVQMTFSPLMGVQAVLSYWIVSSKVIAGKVTLQNNTQNERAIRIEWISLLVPNLSGQRMVPDNINNVYVLHGNTDSVVPVLFVAGGAKPSTGPYMSLFVENELSAGSQFQSVCALASFSDLESSFNSAHLAVNSNWAAEEARIIMVNSRQIQVITGNPEWDEILNNTQIIAARLAIRSNGDEPISTFLLDRQPDHGFSRSQEGIEEYLWNGQTTLNTLFYCLELIPQYPERSLEYLQNFLSSQSEDGFVDWKPGNAKDRIKLAATPVLCYMVWIIYEHLRDKEFLKANYPKLLKYINYWFSPELDRDQDGIPEWTHVYQTGFDDNPLFSHWSDNARGIQISVVESPDLCSMLFNEIQVLIWIAKEIGAESDIQLLRKRAAKIKTVVDSIWVPEKHCYVYRDRDTHITPIEQVLITEKNEGNYLIHQNFEQPVRLNFFVRHAQEKSRKLVIFIHGTSSTGGHRVERIEPSQFEWHMDKGYVTSDKAFLQIEKVIVEGLLEDDLLTIRTIGINNLDQTLLLPIWARIPKKERVKEILEHLLIKPEFFGNPFGIPTVINEISTSKVEIHIPYNVMLLRGLMQYGYRKEAAEILSRILNMLASNYQREGCFRRVYNARNGQGNGEINSLEGLAPLNTFLNILGIRIFSPWKIEIQGFNPFPWPVTVKYCGMSVLRQAKKTTVVFSDGQTISYEGDGPRLISLREKSN